MVIFTQSGIRFILKQFYCSTYICITAVHIFALHFSASCFKFLYLVETRCSLAVNIVTVLIPLCCDKSVLTHIPSKTTIYYTQKCTAEYNKLLSLMVKCIFLISNFRPVLNAVRFLMGNSPASEFYMPTFRNTLFNLHRRVGMKGDWGWECWSIYIGKCLARK